MKQLVCYVISYLYFLHIKKKFRLETRLKTYQLINQVLNHQLKINEIYQQKVKEREEIEREIKEQYRSQRRNKKGHKLGFKDNLFVIEENEENSRGVRTPNNKLKSVQDQLEKQNIENDEQDWSELEYEEDEQYKRKMSKEQ